jgi:hypothetical protein
VLRELAAVYEVTVADLIGDAPGSDRPEISELLDMGRRLSPAQVRGLVDFLRLVSPPAAPPPLSPEPPRT